MDDIRENTQKVRKIHLSYRQVIFFCLGGLMAVLFLIFFAYFYYDFREECRESALQKAHDTAENVAVWTDEYFGLSGMDAQVSVWRQGVEEYVDRGEGIVVLDGQGQMVFSTDPALEGLCQSIGDDNSESPILSVGGGTFLAVGTSVSETQKWTCIAFHDVAEEMEEYRFPIGRFGLAVLLTGICFSAAACLIYRPIDRLLKSVDSELRHKLPRERELEFLGGSLIALKDDSQKLRKMMHQKQDKLKEVFALRLIRGDISLWEEYDEYVKDFNMDSPQCFVTAVAVLNLREEEETQSNIQEDAICLKIVDEMPDHLKKLAWIPPVYNTCAIVAILGDENEELVQGRIQEYYTELQSFSEAVCGYQLLLGVSAVHADPRHISMAYRESVNALTRSGSGSQTAADNVLEDCHFFLTDRSSSEAPYDAAYEKKIQSGIKNMDKAQCHKATNEFFRYLAEENYDQDEIMVYVLRFVDTILLTALEIRVDIETLHPGGLRRLYDELLEVLEPSRERRYIKRNLIDPILEARSKLMEKRSYSLLEDIEQLIRDRKGDISLAECAESLGVHTTYIWKILKTERGKTFSDFLEEYKLDEAKRLLLNTNMTVAEIASTLNYTNAQNFIRFFSKSTGMTPGKFRKLN